MDALDLIFPKKCLGCGKEGKYICATCLAKCSQARPICPYCRGPAILGITHKHCLPRYGLNGLISLWNYEEIIRRAIISLKYKFASEIAQELARTSSQKLKAIRYYPKATLVPVPLFWFRKNWRGFNQSEEIGKVIVQEMGWKFAPNLLIREKITVPQAGLTAQKRLRNIQGVFSLNPACQSLALSHWPLILFDDVWTTGSTLKEAAKVLKHGGVEKVWGLTIAR
jgi:ComF family protein